EDRGLVRREVEHAGHVLARGREAAVLEVEDDEIGIAVAVVVDVDVELGRIVRVRPLAEGVDGELDAEGSAPDADEAGAHGPQVDDGEVAPWSRQEFAGDLAARPEQGEDIDA